MVVTAAVMAAWPEEEDNKPYREDKFIIIDLSMINKK